MILRFRRSRIYIAFTLVFLCAFYYYRTHHSATIRTPTSRRSAPDYYTPDLIPPDSGEKRPARNPAKRIRRQKQAQNKPVDQPQKPLQKDEDGFPQIALPGANKPGAAVGKPPSHARPNIYPDHPSKGNKGNGPSFQPGKQKAEKVTGEALGALLKQRVHWEKQPEHFPVPKGDLIPLPEGKRKAIPRVQASFRGELITHRRIREKKLNAIKGTFLNNWDNYRDRAWEHDELKPVSGEFRDPLAGWRSTLVDNLDTLWIMGLKDRFEEGLAEVESIDFKTTLRVALPLFEITIRYLGGLIAAYDVSLQKYDILLSKATELADVLLGAFDTPNRMPMTQYHWQPAHAREKKTAPDMLTLSELGSMSLEFTRLAQITQEVKYYDAVARITNELDAWQSKTKLPGMWPLKIDATGGCAFDELQKSHSASKGPPLEKRDAAVEKRDAPTERDNVPLDKCVTRGLASFRGDKAIDKFSIAGSADSAYEYLPKMHLILGGMNKQYETLHQAAVKTLSEYLLFQPMIENEERKVLFIGDFTTSGTKTEDDKRIKGVFQPTTTHLSCFAGAWIGLGARVFDRDQDVDVAAKLTDGCVWAYEQTSTGIMPESMDLVPCPDQNGPCQFNETHWWAAIDPEATSKAGEEATNKQHHDAPEQDDSFGRYDPEIFDKALMKRQVVEEPQGRPNTKDDPTLEKSNRFLGSESRAEQGGAKLRSQGVRKKTNPTDNESSRKDTGPSYTEIMQDRILTERLKPGISHISQREYMLRPEALESIFYMWRMTGDYQWREKGWTMFEAINTATETEYGNSAIWDVTEEQPKFRDNAESFWTAETLKYAYLLFSDPDTISLDDYVFNTEGHPFRRPDAKKAKPEVVDLEDGIGM